MIRALVIASVALAGACSKDKPAPLDAAWFGKVPAPPGKLAGVRPKMTLDEAKPFLGRTEPRPVITGQVSVIENLGHPRVSGSLHFEQGRLEAVLVEVKDKGCEAVLQAAWGPGEMVQPPVGDKVREWINARDGWRVDESPSSAGCDVHFEFYRPADAAFFGSVPAPPPALARIKLGMTIEEAREAAPDIIGPADEPRWLGWIGPSNVDALVDDEDTGRVKHLMLMCDGDVLPVIEQAWGKPSMVVAADGSFELDWPDPTGTWRVHAEVAKDPVMFFVTFDAPR